MQGLVGAFKKFLGNKNTVTLGAVIIGVLVLFFFYNYRVNNAISIMRIPYSKVDISPGDKIETDNKKVGEKVITTTALKDSDIITNLNDLTDKYICTGYSIPANGFFYKSQLCDKDQISNSVYENLPNGFTIYALKVDSNSTTANAIKPYDYIDLYASGVDELNKVEYGPLFESIRVRAVRDSNNKDLYETGESPSLLLFEVSENQNVILSLAESNTRQRVKITPVLRNKDYTDKPGLVKIANMSLCNKIVDGYYNFPYVNLCSNENNNE